jgi:hypothetical protein
MVYREPPEITAADEMRDEAKTIHAERPKGDFAPMVPSWLAYLYTPILPPLIKIKVRRYGSRDYNPEDILLPAGYMAGVVVTGKPYRVELNFASR